MRTIALRRCRVVAGIAAWLMLPAGAHAASWLDAPPAFWNTPGMSVPHAPPPGGATLARCSNQEAPPAGPQEQQLAAAGWKLERYWPAVHEGDVTLVTALTGYDGMCRPLAFNAFVFAGNRFAGTLAPAPMDSRKDGELAINPLPSVEPGGRIRASFIRYAPTDALCCPSRGRTNVLFEVRQTPEGPVLAPVQVGPVAVPGAMPRTGAGGGPGPRLPEPVPVLPLTGLLATCAAAAGIAAWRSAARSRMRDQ